MKRKRKYRAKDANPLTVATMRGRPKLKKQIKAYLNYCEYDRNMSPATMDFKYYCLSEFIRGINVRSLEELANDDINGWVEQMTKDRKKKEKDPSIKNKRRRGKSPDTINHCLAQTIAMLKWERDMGVMMPDMHITMIKKQKVPDPPYKKDYYTRDEVTKVLTMADRREWVAISILFDTGIRIAELTNIRLCHINDREISIVGKGSKAHFVMVSELTRRRMDEYIESKGITDCLFPGRYGDAPMSTQQMRRNMRKPFVAAGFNDFHPHMMRHSFAMDLLHVQEVPVRGIQGFLGHSKLETTEVYLAKHSKAEERKLWLSQRFGDNYTLEYPQPVENSFRKVLTSKTV